MYPSDDPVIPLSYPTAFRDTVNGRTATNNVQLINGGAVGHDWAVCSAAGAKTALQVWLSVVYGFVAAFIWISGECWAP